jgi:TonB-linked SusC/RagA family outer membrane protein
MMKYILMFAAFFCAASASAQQITVKSQIRSTDNSPVGGAIITIPGQRVSSISDKTGTFELKANNRNGIVTIKANGYYEKTMPLNYLIKSEKKASFKITLVPESEKLYNGTSEIPFASLSRENKSVSTTGIENKDFSDKLSLGAATRDGVAGLQIIEKSGMPGEGTYMNIRGIHSIVAENSPLLVVNGVPYMIDQSTSQVVNGYSRDMLFGYDPNDIKSVTVLKGADAAMFGSLGSNGVIMIETQQATSDNLDTRISFSGQYGFNLANRSLPVMNSNQYKTYLQSIGMTRYSTMSELTEDYSFLQNTSNYYSYLFNENTDWMKQIQHTGLTTENLFRVEGGDEIAKYNISFGYTGNHGTVKGTDNNRYHTLISSNILVSRKVDIFTNVGLAYITDNMQNQGMEMQTNPILSAYYSMPLLSPYKKQSDGSLLSTFAAYDDWNTNNNPSFSYDNVSNPLAIVKTVEAKDKIYDANLRLGVNYHYDEYLKLTALANIYYNYTEENLFVPGVDDGAILPGVFGTGKNKVAMGVIKQSADYFSLSAQYNRIFNSIHEFNGVASARMIIRNNEFDISSGYNTANDYYQTLGNTTNEKLITGDNQEWKYLSYMLHGEYTYNRLIKATAGITVDGTSVSGADASRWGFFPSADVTFMAANTGSLPSWINLFNISLEASLTGNSRFSSNYGKSYYASRNLFNIGAIVRSDVPNTKLQWEKNRQIDFGIDLSIFSGKVDLGVNLFCNRAYDLLLNSEISAVYGSTNYYDNQAEISGKGAELSLRLNPIHTKDFDFVIAANVAAVKNEVKSLGGINAQTIKFTGYNNDDAEVRMVVGEKPYEFYGYKTEGIYSTAAEAAAANLVNVKGVAYQAGDMKFVDVSGPNGTPDGVINDYDKVSLGSAQPDCYGGINLMLRYKAFSVDANFGYTIGNKAYNATRRQLESMSTFYNQSTSVLNRWTVEGQVTSIPRAAYGDPSGNDYFSDRWIEDADYFKLRSIRLSYNFKKLFDFIRSGSVYLAGENLFCLTDYLGSDPEFAYSYNESMRGFDYAKVALPITIKIGFNLNF